MEVICNDASEVFALSLRMVSCCDYYEDNVVFIREKKSKNDKNVIKRFDDCNDCNYCDNNVSGLVKHLSNSILDGSQKQLIQFIHDMTMQIKYLHKNGLTFTDIDGNDILSVYGRYCIVNTYKLIPFDKKTGYGSLRFPVSFGKYAAPELSCISTIPAINAIHKNSVIWSIGRIVFDSVWLFDNDDNDNFGSSNVQSCEGIIDETIITDDLFDNYFDKFDVSCSSNDSIVLNFVKRCLWIEPKKRIMVIV